MRRRPLSYGDEGDIEYFDYNVDELRNSENTESLLENSTSDNLRMRGARDRSNNDDDDETQPILVV